MTDSLRLEGGAYDKFLNDTEAPLADADRYEAILDRIPAGRWGDPPDLAEAAVLLCPPAARDVHGAVLNVDGGWLAR